MRPSGQKPNRIRPAPFVEKPRKEAPPHCIIHESVVGYPLLCAFPLPPRAGAIPWKGGRSRAGFTGASHSTL